MSIEPSSYSRRAIDSDLLTGESPFRNKLLVAMPNMHDGLFHRSVIYLCAHSTAGAMGIMINQKLPDIAFGDLLSQLHLPKSRLHVDPLVHFGGPVDTGRGFVLHSTDFMRDDTVRINDTLCLTGTIDILQALAEGRGPRKSLFALGYAGWAAGQLEEEMHANSWLTVPADTGLLFDNDLQTKWERALGHLGANPLTLSAEAGHA
jgi:putative transcriptional regulator